MQKQGAYILVLEINQPLELAVGSLKRIQLPAGVYAYVGSARKGIAQRISRHKRLAEQKKGNIRWHIDYLLTYPEIRMLGSIDFEGAEECSISHRIAALEGVSTPVPGFGSTDCRHGCKAHLYRLTQSMEHAKAVLSWNKNATDYTD